MTVAALDPAISYLEDGVTVNFAVPFRYIAAADLSVSRVAADGTVTALAHGTDWSASAAPTDAGGALTLASTVAGATLRIRRATERRQASDYATGDRFPADTLEGSLDRAMLIDQEQDRQIANTAERALLVPDGEVVAELPSEADRAGKLLAFDAGGAPVAATPAGGEDLALRGDLALPSGTALVGGPDGTLQAALNARVAIVTSRTAMAALNVTRFSTCVLTEAGREGMWKLFPGSAPADLWQGIYVSSDTPSYYWARLWDHMSGQAGWFGAVVNDTAARSTNDTVIAAAMLVCPEVRLLKDDYYVSAPVVVPEYGRLHGAGMDYDGARGTATRIITNAASGEILRVGSKTWNGVGGLNSAPQAHHVSDLCLVRTGAMVGSDDNAVGVWVGFSLFATMERVRVQGANTHGFRFAGAIYVKGKELRAKRDVAASSGTDKWYGFTVDGAYLMKSGTDTLTAINGNASLYLEGCQAEWNLDSDTTSLSIGMYFTSKITDTFVDKFEVTGGQYGIAVDGTGGTTEINSANDCRIRSATIDQTTVAAYYFNNVQKAGYIRVQDAYGGFASGRGLLIQNCKGRIDFDGELYNAVGTDPSVEVTGSTGARVKAFSHEAQVHARIGNSTGCELDITGCSISRTATDIIQSIGSNSRNVYRMAATGAAGKITNGLRSFVGSAPYDVNSDHNEYHTTKISAADVVSAVTNFAASQEAASVKVGV